jgi:hypothetical protein
MLSGAGTAAGLQRRPRRVRNDDYFGITGTDHQHRYKLRHDLHSGSRIYWPHLVSACPRLADCDDVQLVVEADRKASCWGWSADELSRLFGRDIFSAGTRLGR